MKTQKLTQRFVAAAVAATLIMVSHSMAQKVSESELRFREALHKQQVEGDLPTAIKLYQEIASSKTADRAVRARALLQLASCYDTLGRQSEAVYQQIVREFGDQPAAAQARAKLAALRPPVPPTMTLRKIEFGPGVQNVVATDGQRAVYWDRTNTALFFGDIAGKDKRVVFQTKLIPRTVVSRDLGMVFFYFPASPQEPAKYAVIKTDGTGYRNFTLTENGEKLPVTAPICLSWSWDNRYLLMCKPRETDSTIRLLKISVAEGAAVDLLPGQGTSVFSAEFSPDGRFIAYGLRPLDVVPGVVVHGLDVYLTASEGGANRRVAADAGLVDWTSDGRYLMISESRSGNAVISAAVPIQNGEAVGERVPIQSSLSDLGDAPHTMPNGTVIIRRGGGPISQVSLGILDAQDRVRAWKPLELIEPGADPFPVWSPDGRQIAYVAGKGTNFRGAIRIRTVESSEDRELYRSFSPITTCLWGHQHPSLYCGQFTGTKTDILSVSLDSGRIEKLGTLDGTRVLWKVSPDDRLLATSLLEGGPTGHQWEIGTDREIRGIFGRRRSDDGRWIIGGREDQREIRIRPASGTDADWKHLVYLRKQLEPQYIGVLLDVRFTPDGNWIVYHDKDADGKDGFYRVSTAGGEPERLGDYPTDQLSMISVSPDGRSFIVSALAPPKQPEFWVLDNFIPKAASAAAKPVSK